MSGSVLTKKTDYNLLGAEKISVPNKNPKTNIESENNIISDTYTDNKSKTTIASKNDDDDKLVFNNIPEKIIDKSNMATLSPNT